MIFLAFFAPLGLYLLYLGGLNRGRHPVLIPGTWDFVGILFALSGFLLLGGPAILTGLHEQWRVSWVLGQVRFLNDAGESWRWWWWIILWAAYFVVIVAWLSWMFRRQRSITSVYNIEPAVFQEVLGHALDAAGLATIPGGKRQLWVRERQKLPTTVAAGSPSMAAAEDAGGPWISIEWEGFAPLRNVTVHWGPGFAAVREELESALATQFAAVETPPHGTGLWMFCIGSLFLLTSFLLLLLLVALRLLRVLT